MEKTIIRKIYLDMLELLCFFSFYTDNIERKIGIRVIFMSNGVLADFKQFPNGWLSRDKLTIWHIFTLNSFKCIKLLWSNDLF